MEGLALVCRKAHRDKRTCLPFLPITLYRPFHPSCYRPGREGTMSASEVLNLLASIIAGAAAGGLTASLSIRRNSPDQRASGHGKIVGRDNSGTM